MKIIDFKKSIKSLKIITSNLFIILFLLVLAEFALNLRYHINFFEHIDPQELKTFTTKTHIKHYLQFIENHYAPMFKYFDPNITKVFEHLLDSETYRKPIFAKNPNEDTIVLFGCSFTYGSGLKEEQAFHSKLNKYWDKTVYNYGYPGGSPKEILYILRNWEKLKNHPNKNEIEYFIYTFKSSVLLLIISINVVTFSSVH